MPLQHQRNGQWCPGFPGPARRRSIPAGPACPVAVSGVPPEASGAAAPQPYALGESVSASCPNGPSSNSMTRMPGPGISGAPHPGGFPAGRDLWPLILPASRIQGASSKANTLYRNLPSCSLKRRKARRRRCSPGTVLTRHGVPSNGPPGFCFLIPAHDHQRPLFHQVLGAG